MSTCIGGNDLDDFIVENDKDGVKDTFLDGFIADMDLGECLYDVSLRWPTFVWPMVISRDFLVVDCY